MTTTKPHRRIPRLLQDPADAQGRLATLLLRATDAHEALLQLHRNHLNQTQTRLRMTLAKALQPRQGPVLAHYLQPQLTKKTSISAIFVVFEIGQPTLTTKMTSNKQPTTLPSPFRPLQLDHSLLQSHPTQLLVTSPQTKTSRHVHVTLQKALAKVRNLTLHVISHPLVKEHSPIEEVPFRSKHSVEKPRKLNAVLDSSLNPTNASSPTDPTCHMLLLLQP